MKYSSTRLPCVLACAGALIAGCATAVFAQDAEVRELTFTSLDGGDVGTATLTGTPYGVLIRLDMQNLPPESWHGFHIHETGECDPEDGFKSAGGHFTVSDTDHGFMIDGGPHTGDMPNQYVAADGTLKAEVLNTYAILGGNADNVSGRAIVLHGGVDDYESQPSGDAGDRIACAVID